MKTLKNENYKDNNIIIKDEKGKEITTRKLIEIILRNSQYKTTNDQMTAFGIVNNLDKKLKLEKGFIQIEDADFKLIDQLTNEYQPIKKGLVFAPFLEALKIANQ